DFDQLPRRPWCYWAESLEYRLFRDHPSLGTRFPIDMGLKTSDNVRFVRYWWEVGLDRIGRGKWFPYAKGGSGARYAARVTHVVNWADDGAEIKAFLAERYPYLAGRSAWCTHDESL